jgi:hypothetical protein
LYGCEAWSVTLRKEHGLRKVFGPERDKITGGWRKVHNEEFHNFPSSPHLIRRIKSKRMKWIKHVAYMGEKGHAFIGLVGKAEGKTWT